MTDVATLSSKYQICIPKAVRDRENWEPGQKFSFIPRDGAWLLVPVPKLHDLLGLAEGAKTGTIRDRNDRY